MQIVTPKISTMYGVQDIDIIDRCTMLKDSMHRCYVLFVIYKLLDIFTCCLFVNVLIFLYTYVVLWYYVFKSVRKPIVSNFL